jgi:glycosyltransferase involved in cell wall biosynthesis
MRILFLHSSADLYGSGRILVSAVSVLLKAGHEGIVVLPEEGPLSSTFRDLGANVEIRELGILRRKYFNVLGMLNRIACIIGATLGLANFIRRQRIDLVYTNTAAVFVGGFAARISGRPHVWHIQEIVVTPAVVAKVIAWMVKHFADEVIAVSTAVKTNLDSRSPGENEKVHVVFSAIEHDQFEARSAGTLRSTLGVGQDDVIVGMIGRVHFWKGQKYFLQIAGALHKKYTNVRFVMIGDAFPGYEFLYDELNSTKRDLALDGVVFDLGFRKDVPDLLVDFDVFVLPSTLPDPFPTVVLEAMWSGKPVVATEHGGALEMVDHGKTGFLIPWDDPQRSVAILEPLIASRALRIEMGHAGRERIALLFSLSAFSKGILTIVDNLIPRRDQVTPIKGTQH